MVFVAAKALASLAEVSRFATKLKLGTAVLRENSESGPLAGFTRHDTPKRGLLMLCPDFTSSFYESFAA